MVMFRVQLTIADRGMPATVGPGELAGVRVPESGTLLCMRDLKALLLQLTQRVRCAALETCTQG